MPNTLISSPLQGFTDYRFRNAFHKYFGGIDTYYAPYIRLNGKMEVKPVYQRDLKHKHNIGLVVIPQVMTCDADEFLFVIEYVQSLGYTELNWNLGCPYPMVTNRGMGSGLIANPEKINHILDRAHSETNITISMKMRLGYCDPTEILDAFPVLNNYPLKNIGIHARIGKQLYVGGVDWDSFERCMEHTDHKLYYNGDITSVKAFRKVSDRFPTIDHWMIGRGLIADPWLPRMIKENDTEYPIERIDVFSDFHAMLFRQFEEKLTGDKAIIRKMVSYWEYFEEVLPQAKREIKKLKKTKTIEAYDEALKKVYSVFEGINIFDSYE
ncbi:MAG: tRNA-dihydrouridine synthase family protein [Saprospiraceae bacterium]|nr:tRNA-dihydrouridine synthase family protein [Saprospiraceae bacterium]